MGSEPDRKRRHFSSISPKPVMAKKQPFAQLSEGKKLGTAVLQYQNQKLAQKLEVQKIEYSALENKFSQLKDKQGPCDSTIKALNNCWKWVIMLFCYSLCAIPSCICM
uniref:E3 ubiquitin protein ligase n=1 Tax=Rhizophora mucronata TaxID=61149 RepID=A0A2P2J7N4_RHIMU